MELIPHQHPSSNTSGAGAGLGSPNQMALSSTPPSLNRSSSPPKGKPLKVLSWGPLHLPRLRTYHGGWEPASRARQGPRVSLKKEERGRAFSLGSWGPQYAQGQGQRPTPQPLCSWAWSRPQRCAHSHEAGPLCTPTAHGHGQDMTVQEDRARPALLTRTWPFGRMAPARLTADNGGARNGTTSPETLAPALL